MMDALSRIEAILSEVERLERESGYQFTEKDDVKEALASVSEIERRMLEGAKI